MPEKASGSRLCTDPGEQPRKDAGAAPQPGGRPGRSPVVLLVRRKAKAQAAVVSPVLCKNLCPDAVGERLPVSADWTAFV